MHRTRIFQILNLRRTLDSGLLHAIPQLARVHELSRLIGTRPIQQQENVVRIFQVVENMKAYLSRTLTGDDMLIESFLPAVEIRYLVTDQDMNHQSVLHISNVSSKIRNLQRNVNSQMNKAL